jgi:hypothetical protein
VAGEAFEPRENALIERAHFDPVRHLAVQHGTHIMEIRKLFPQRRQFLGEIQALLRKRAVEQPDWRRVPLPQHIARDSIQRSQPRTRSGKNDRFLRFARRIKNCPTDPETTPTCSPPPGTAAIR